MLDTAQQSITTANVTGLSDGSNGLDFDYTYDENKNKLTEMISAPMAAYGFGGTTASAYDNEDRLTGWNRDDANKTQAWALSKVGDWDTFNETGATPLAETRTHGAAHELNMINAVALAHDVKGNITTNSNGQTYTWDFDNQLKTATVPTGAPGIIGTHVYTYDALGRRVSKAVMNRGTGRTITTVFVCSGQRVLAEYLANNRSTTAERKYIYASYIDERCVMVDRTSLGALGVGVEELLYYHINNLFSVAALTDTSANIVERYAYDSYGNTIFLNAAGTPLATQVSLYGNEYLYTGQRLDAETGLYFYKARYYDTALGRFISRDPVFHLNLYAYVSNSPTNRLDPTGNDGILFNNQASAKRFAEDLEGKGAEHVRFYYSHEVVTSGAFNTELPEELHYCRLTGAVWVYTDYRDMKAVFDYADEHLPAQTSNRDRNSFLLSSGVLPNRYDSDHFYGQKLLGGEAGNSARYQQSDPITIAGRIDDNPNFRIDIGGEGRNRGHVNINTGRITTTPGPTDTYKRGETIKMLFMIGEGDLLPFKTGSVSFAYSQQTPFDSDIYLTEIPRVLASDGHFHVWSTRNFIGPGIQRYFDANPNSAGTSIPRRSYPTWMPEGTERLPDEDQLMYADLSFHRRRHD